MGDIEILRPHKKGEAPISLAKIKREWPIIGGMQGGLHYKAHGKEAMKNPETRQAIKNAQEFLSQMQKKVKRPKPFTNRVLNKIKGRGKAGKVIALGLKFLE